jgi:hypothetical protein
MAEMQEARPGEIVDAALEVFAEKGFAAAKLDDIAHRAGISKAEARRGNADVGVVHGGAGEGSQPVQRYLRDCCSEDVATVLHEDAEHHAALGWGCPLGSSS